MSNFGIDLAMQPGYEFVLHQVLCVTALHAATLQSSIESREYLDLIEAAHHHSDLSMSGFRQSVTSIGSHNALHVFLYTAFISIYIWARTNPMLQRYNNDLDDGFMQLSSTRWMRTARGTTSLLGDSGTNVGGSITDSPLEILIPYKGHFDPLIPAQDSWAQACQDRLKDLSTILNGRNDHVSRTCSETLRHLDECLRQTAFARMLLKDPSFRDPAVDIEGLQLKPRPNALGIAWVFRISTDYLDLIDEGRSEAILILAHYGVIMHRIPDLWTIGGFGKAITEACGAHFAQLQDEAWQKWMQWPAEAIRHLDEERHGTVLVP
jgi:hypothetical protein